MNNIKITLLLFITCTAVLASCKKQLDVKNPNQPNPETLKTEFGIIAYGKGGVYTNGFKTLKYSDGIIGEFFSGVWGLHEMMGDVIGMEAANVYANQLSTPNKVTLDNGTVVLSPAPPNKQIQLLRDVNQNATAGNNPVYYEWAYMYALNNVCNVLLETAGAVGFSGDAASKINTIRAWAYWWKGYAYARIGSMYYAGLIRDSSLLVNSRPGGNYVSKEAVITESNSNFDKAIQILNDQAHNDAYKEVLGKLIPSFNQVGKGNIPTPAMWIRNCNTMKARNLLVNKPVSDMTLSDWTAILTLTNTGIQKNDMVFTGRSNANSDFLTTSGGTVAARATSSSPGGNTYKISERLIQDFPPGDKRKQNNFVQGTTWTGNPDRGNIFNTRWALKDGGAGLPGVIVYSNKTDGGTEHYIAGTWEENELMKAEAILFSGGAVATATAIIDEVRNYQGAGLLPVGAVSLTEAKEELRKERRVGLAFRGLSFYDARRWKVTEPISGGGGRTGAVVLSSSGVVNTSATIEFNYLDYWDVPDNELVYNPPAEGSAAVKNPK